MTTSSIKKSTESAKGSDKKTDTKQTASKGGSKSSDSKKETGSTKK